MELIQSIAEAIPAWLEAILALVVACAGIAALTPTPKDDAAVGKVLSFLRKVIDVVGLNVGNAKNKDSK